MGLGSIHYIKAQGVAYSALNRRKYRIPRACFEYKRGKSLGYVHNIILQNLHVH